MIRSVLVVVALLAAGCTAEANPPPASESTEVEEAVAASAPSEVHPLGIPCEPGSKQACSRVWVDALGATNCMTGFQYCRSDARAWLECGAPYDGPPEQ